MKRKTEMQPGAIMYLVGSQIARGVLDNKTHRKLTGLGDKAWLHACEYAAARWAIGKGQDIRTIAVKLVLEALDKGESC